MAEHIVRTVQYNPDGSLAIDYMSAGDQRDNGMMMSRALFVPPSEELQDLRLADLVEDLTRMTERVLSRSIELHESARVASFGDDDDDDDDEERPYDNPLPDR